MRCVSEPRLQVLLTPMEGGAKNIADVAIDMPEEISAPLRTIFQWDIMGAEAEFEGRALYGALRGFADLCREGKICEIHYDAEDHGRHGRIYALCNTSFGSAAATVDFMADQVLKRPTVRCGRPVDFRRAVFGPNKAAFYAPPQTIGWFDLDNKRFFFTDVAAFAKLKALFRLEGLPVLDKDLNFYPQIGESCDQAAAGLQKLADIWGEPLRIEVSPGQIVEAHPAPGAC